MIGARRAAALAAMTAAIAFAACGGDERTGGTAAEADIEAIVREVVAAIPERDPETVLRHVALEFRGGPSGREPDLDHADANAIVLEFLLREHPISARIEDLRAAPAEADGTRRAVARVWFDASDVLVDPASAVPSSAVRYRFELRFARREGTWQAIEARYERLAPGPS
jgi:hypothetical protein